MTKQTTPGTHLRRDANFSAAIWLRANTGREYVAAWIEGDYAQTFALDLSDIVKADTEASYAITDKLDAVLDLRIGERLQFRFNRDNPDSLGFIKRIK